MGQSHAVDIAGFVFQVEAELHLLNQFNRAILEGPDPQFWALQIHHHRNGAGKLLFQSPNDVQSGLMFRMGTMTEVQPEHVHAGFKQRLNGGLVPGSRTQCGDNLGTVLTAHGCASPFSC